MKKIRRGTIFNYWKDKCIDKYGNEYNEGDYPIEKTIPVVIDWYEQHCFACGMKVISHNIQYENWVEYENFHQIWNDCETDVQLEKAHILAQSLGGPTEPSNLFLLCHNCHTESPDIANRKMFMKWIYDMRKHKYYCQRGNYKIFPQEYYNKAKDILARDYNIKYPILNSLTDIARIGKTITFHQNKIVNSSYIYLLVSDGLRNRSGLNKKGEKMFENRIRGRIAELFQENPDDEKIKIYQEVLAWYRKAKMFEEDGYDEK